MFCFTNSHFVVHVLVEKELLEIPDDEIRFLPIKDLLRLVDYKEWLEVKHPLLSSAHLHDYSLDLPCIISRSYKTFLLMDI